MLVKVLKENDLQIRHHVAAKLKRHRKLLGHTQEEVAQCLGITPQQLQKYEKGVDRISAERLWGLSTVFSVPLTFFYEGLSVKR